MNNKLFSIFGDSISTLEGCNPEEYNVFYTGENAKNANVLKDIVFYKRSYSNIE